MSDCRFGVSPINYPDHDPDPDPGLYVYRSIYHLNLNLQPDDLS